MVCTWTHRASYLDYHPEKLEFQEESENTWLTVAPIVALDHTILVFVLKLLLEPKSLVGMSMMEF